MRSVYNNNIIDTGASAARRQVKTVKIKLSENSLSKLPLIDIVNPQPQSSKMFYARVRRSQANTAKTGRVKRQIV